MAALMNGAAFFIDSKLISGILFLSPNDLWICHF